MQKLLLKRTLRDLRANAFRYLALFLLIVLAMFIVVATVASAESIITSVEQTSEETHLEDGQFGVFVPLEDSVIEELEKKGVTLEECFYLDFAMEDNSTLRLMKNREKINLLSITEGHIAETDSEAAIERIYATAHAISVGDAITIAGNTYTVCGIVTSSDYDACMRNMSDMSCDGSLFGTAFVTEEAYARLLDEKQALHSEEYRYSYLLGSTMTNDDIKDYLLNLKISPDEVDNVFFQELVEEQMKDRNELTDGIQELVDGADSLQDGLSSLSGHNADIQTATDALSPYLAAVPGAENYASGITACLNGIAEAAVGSSELADGIHTLQDKTDEMLDEYFPFEIENLTDFVVSEDNPRVAGSSNDVEININVGLMAGVIVLILITYVVSVFIIHSIEQESAMIGALYALGLKRRQLMLHYTMLPVLLCLVGGILGTLAGYSDFGISINNSETAAYYSTPEITTNYNPLLLVYGMVLPPVIALAVNLFIIRKKLNRTALSLLRKEQTQKKTSSIRLKTGGFIRTFQIRQFLREKRSCFAVLAGMFISLLILILGLNCYSLCLNVQTDNIADTKYGYMYLYKYPTATVPEGGYEAYIEGLNKEVYGYDMEVTIIGLTKENPFFPTITSNRKNEISISDSVAKKYSLSVGEKLILSDKVNEREYGFTIKEIVPYSVGLSCFMDIDSMRELFDREDDYYNAVYSDKEIDVETDRLLSVSTKADIEKSSDIFMKIMMPMMTSMVVISTLIFLIVMYQMIRVMIDRSAFSISLMKIFGYRSREIRRLYLDGNFLLISVSALVLIPLAKLLMDAVYPSFIANVSCGISLSWQPSLYIIVYVGILLCYLIIRTALMHRLKKLTPAEVLKDRE